jgi:P2 family phage major capsid protein
MEDFTRERFEKFSSNIATLNAVPSARAAMVGTANAQAFTVDPSVQQTLVKRMQESAKFLSRINILPRNELVGSKIGMSINSLIGRNIDTTNGGQRVGVDPTSLDAFGYHCRKTNYDTRLPYDKLDMWAKFPEFETYIRDEIVTAQALDRIKIGFNGTTWSATSDPVAHPLGQDLNRGWLEAMREENPARTLSAVTGGKVAGHVTYGAAGDFSNIDALVWSLKQEMLPEWARYAPGLCAIVGDDLVMQKYGAIVSRTESSLDQIARDSLMSVLPTGMQFGGLPGVRVPYFPAGAVLVTVLGDGNSPFGSNLSLYYQDGKNRRNLWDRPDQDAVVDYQSANEAFVVEDYTYAAFAENILQKEV